MNNGPITNKKKAQKYIDTLMKNYREKKATIRNDSYHKPQKDYNEGNVLLEEYWAQPSTESMEFIQDVIWDDPQKPVQKKSLFKRVWDCLKGLVL